MSRPLKNKHKARPKYRASHGTASAVQKVGRTVPLAEAAHCNRLVLAGVSLFLIAIVWFVFGQVSHFGFVNYDDDVYVTDNPMVQHGLTLKGLSWAFALTRGRIGHWHPLTWLSHMLDCQLYGMWAGGAHLTNLILHAATVVCLFLVLRNMTGALWRSAFVAAVWAIHPLRVESVAWIAERKDVLSGLFFVLVLGAYVRYIRNPSAPRYLLVALVFALGLLAKDMLVTVPCLLLLLDYWPLRRWESAAIPRLLVEKIPLFLLSAGSCMTTFLLSDHATERDLVPALLRTENALVSYVIYFWQTFWPADLAIPYVLRSTLFPIRELAGAITLLIVLSAAAVFWRKSRPWFFAGWFWFLGMLVPVIGLVQISYYAHADRYTYLPQIGLLIALTWTVADAGAEFRLPRWFFALFSLGLIAGLLLLARGQTSYWRDGQTLFTHSLACTEGNYLAFNNLGTALQEEGRLDDAIAFYQKALEVRPDYALALGNLGIALERSGRMDQAVGDFKRTLELDPDNVKVQNNFGLILSGSGRFDEAIAHYQKALESKPAYVEARYNLAIALEGKGEWDAAIAQLQNTLEIMPDFAPAHNNLGNALRRVNRLDEAIAHYRKAVESKPDYALAYANLGGALLQKGEGGEAIAAFQKALQIKPDDADARFDLGAALQRAGQFEDAIAQYQEALKINPDFVEAASNLAYLFAACKDSRLRNGGKAQELALRANRLSGGNNPVVLDILAAACAETGHFSEAQDTVRRALEIVGAQGDSRESDLLRQHLRLYQAGTPLRVP
jgi:tetratricopeptide (TPR) repeat protein